MLVLILPATNEEGSEIVKEKILASLKDENKELTYKKTIYPQDVSKELIEGYKIEEIYENFLNKIFQK